MTQAQTNIVLRHLWVSDALARRFMHRGIDLDDLRQVARVALVQAVARYNPEQGPFLAFAVPCITGELKRHFRDHGWMVRPPRRLQELRPMVKACREELEVGGGSGTPACEVAERLGVPLGDVLACDTLADSYRPLSLDAPASRGEGERLGDHLADDDKGSVDPSELIDLRRAMRELSPRDRQVLQWRFVDELTQREIGLRLGVTQTQVSRITSRLLGQLRALLEPPAAAA